MLSLCSGWICASSARVRSRSSDSLIVRYSAKGVPPAAHPTGPARIPANACASERLRARHDLPDRAVEVDRIDLAVPALTERGDVVLGDARRLRGRVGDVDVERK